jgi:hypothetical protein
MIAPYTGEFRKERSRPPKKDDSNDRREISALEREPGLARAMASASNTEQKQVGDNVSRD